jgi:hypothetical protein
MSTLDAFESRVAPRPSEIERLGRKGERALNRAHRMLHIQMGSSWAPPDVLDIGPTHLRPNGDLESCGPGDRVEHLFDEEEDGDTDEETET